MDTKNKVMICLALLCIALLIFSIQFQTPTSSGLKSEPNNQTGKNEVSNTEIIGSAQNSGPISLEEAKRSMKK